MPFVVELSPGKELPSTTSVPPAVVRPYVPIQLSKVELWKLTMIFPVTSTALLAPPPIVQLLKITLVPPLSTTFTATGLGPSFAFNVQFENNVALRVSR